MGQSSPPSSSFSYAIASDFMSGVPGARDAAANAVASWDAASSTLSFANAGYEPIVNSFDNWAAGGYAMEGPGGADGGIGANIDVLSRPTGFQFEFMGTTYEFGPTTLAFAMPVVMSGNILSTDVYLNSDFEWGTDGSGFDIETVVLHEVGHALGLDHPDQAAANGAQNYNPYTQQPGEPWSDTEAMHSAYFPDGLNRTLGDDEVGGLAFLYPGLKGDANLDLAFTFADVQLGIDMFFGFADPPNPEALQNLDFGENGVLNFSDVDRLISGFFYPDPQQQSAVVGTGFALETLESMSYDVSGVPEPVSVFLWFSLGSACLRTRNRLA